jgi:hypothetical protein
VTIPQPRRAAPAPKGIGKAGRALWRAVTGEYDLGEHERLMLVEACRIADRLDRLHAEAESSEVTVTNHRGDLAPHPALVEARLQAIALTRLVASLRLPAGDEDEPGRPQRRGAARGAYGLRALP